MRLKLIMVEGQHESTWVKARHKLKVETSN